ncbi:MAG: TIGR04372 family glycosyltransferase [Gammaproteobacteria bacterium]
MLRILSIRYKVSIYVLKTFRPGFASTYLTMMEPLCRQLQHENNARHIKILVDPGESVSNVLVKSYEPHFTMYLDDQKRIARLIAYLIPKSGLEKKFINTSDKFLPSWLYPPSKNYANTDNRVPSDLAEMGIEKGNFVVFTHPSKNYYEDRFSSETLSKIADRFFDLSTYGIAINKIHTSNLKIVRVGLRVDELPANLRVLPIIDCAGQNRSEESELWLYENCKFLLSAANGGFWFARKFDRPTLLTNNYAIIYGYQSSFLVPMVIQNHKSGELLSISEMLDHWRNPNFLSHQYMNDKQLELLPNSSLTIANAVDELLNLGIEKFETTQEDLELMERYKMILKSFNIPIVERMTLPTYSFLREYSNLL